MSKGSDAFEVLAALKGVFEVVGVRWYVFGAQAVIVWGRPRLTADVDVTMALAPEEVERVLPHLQSAGFDPLPEHPLEFVVKTRILPLVHQPTGMLVDLVCGGPGLEMEFVENSRTIEVAGLAIPVISPEDLVIAKVLAGRPKDMEDAESVVLEQAADLDLGRIRSVLGMLEQALDRRDLLWEVDRMVEIARRRG